MKLFTLPISGFFLLMAMFSGVAIAQPQYQCNYLTDVDQDDDGLIEICDLEGLDAIRHQLDGTGYTASIGTMKITNGCPPSGCNGYELTRNLDFVDDNSYRLATNKARYIVTTATDVGWQPIGNSASVFFSATLEGNGYTISNLMINSTSTRFMGLFGYTKNSEINNLGLLNVNIKAADTAGGLVGRHNGTITNSYAIGIISGRYDTGGLVGFNARGTITNSYAMSTVLGRFDTGGLVGFNALGSIINSYATGGVSGHFDAGGLVGVNQQGSITNSHATGFVLGISNRVGGLVGSNNSGTITNSHAIGDATGSSENVGGLVGWNDDGTITSSYAKGSVSGSARSGGLVGTNLGDIIKSYAAGDVASTGDFSGGLVGSNDNTITNSYATGNVSGPKNTSSLVGKNSGTITNSYATGDVSGRATTLGLVGANTNEINNSYWLSGSAVSSLSALAGAEKTAEELKSPIESGTAPTDTYYSWDAAVWDFGTSGQLPILKTSTGNLLSGQGEGLRELKVATLYTELSPTFGDAAADYVITFLTTDGSRQNIALELKAYNPDTMIEIVKAGENTNYFANKGSSGRSNSISVDGGTILGITVTEASLDTTSYRVRVASEQVTLPPCTAFLDIANDNDGVEQDIDIDKDNDGLIEICDVEGLDEMRYQLDGMGYTTSINATKMTDGCPAAGCTGYELMRSLDFMDENSYRASTSKARYMVADYDDSDDTGWQPIGDSASMSFNTTFEGNGYTISNLMINRTSTRFVGLFGYTGTGAEIDNLGLSSVNIKAADTVGGLVGYHNGTITNSYAGGDVSGRFDTGGLVGFNSNGNITNSHAMGTVSGRFDIGGLVGVNQQGNITSSYATSSVSGISTRVGGLVGSNNRGIITNSHATGDARSAENVGGLVGWNRDGTITSSYAKGSVSGGSELGGLVGTNRGDIMKSYATGDIAGESNAVGGLVGSNDNTIINSYATGDVAGLSSASNLVGNNFGSITNSYAIGDVTYAGRGQTSGLVAITSNGINNSYWLSGSAALGGINIISGVLIDAEKTAEELKSPIAPGTAPTDTYYNWDATVWDFGTSNQLPILKTPDGNLLPGQGVGLRELKVATSYTKLSPTFADATTDYIITSYSTNDSVQDIVLELTAYNPDTTIELVKAGEITDYFANKGSSGRSDSISVDGDAVVGITVREANLDTTSYRIEVVSEQVVLPPCTVFLGIVDDNDGVEQDMDIDKDNDGLIEICDVEGLAEMRYQLDGAGYTATIDTTKITDGCPSGGCTGYELTRSLDFTDDNSYRISTNKAKYIVANATDVGWQPIGNSASMSFNATLEGNGNTISNLMINRISTRFIGLFGHTGTRAEIDNLGLLDVDISGRSFVGGLVGNNHGTITNSYALGTVSGRFDIGGLVGVNNGQGIITNSHAMGTVSGRSDIGGLVGQNDRGSITNSYAVAEVRGSSNRVGGLVGRNPGTITTSYATGSVEGKNDVGGLVGSNSGSILNNYAMSDVAGLSSVSNLVGSNSGIITNSYAIGDVTFTGRGQTSGLVAITSSDVNNSYWLSGSAALGGINTTSGIPIDAEKTAEELKSPIAPGATPTDTYYDWDADIWDFGTSNQFPILKTPDGDLLPGQGMGLRGLKVATSYTELSPTFADATTNYVITSYSTNGSMQNIVLELKAYNPDATIELIKAGENSDYFAHQGSSGRSDPIGLDGDTEVNITVREANLDTTSYGIEVVSEQVVLSPCTAFLDIADDNDGIDQDMDIDKDNDGLIEICDLEGLDEIRYQLDGAGYTATTDTTKITDGCPSSGCTGYELTRNLDFMDDNSYRLATNKAEYIVTTATDAGWQPIGDSASMPFDATFDGNGNTISNLMINRTSTRFVGLFGYTGTGAEIDNLGLSSVNIKAADTAGGLVGYHNGTITNSYAGGDVSGRFDTGGLVGFNNGGSIINSHAMGTVSGRFDIGGLVGVNQQGRITSSYATGSVSGISIRVGGLVGSNNRGIITNSHATGDARSAENVGGLVGWNRDGTITSSYAKGSVSGSANLGGLVGTNRGNIIKSYAAGDIIGESNNVGGLVGSNDDNASNIENSYATGDVLGLSSSSNLVGNNFGSITNSYAIGDVAFTGRGQTSGLVAITSNDVNNSYWLSGSAALGGINTTSGIPIDAEKTAEELKSPIAPGATPTDTYYSWDATVWDFGTSNQLPILKTPDGNLLPGQGVGLRELKVATSYTELSPTFTDATTDYVITSYSTNGSMQNIVLELTAYNPDATIELVKAGESTDYFAHQGSGGRSDSISIDGNAVLDITVREANLDTTSYGVEVVSEQVVLPPCTVFLDIVDDNDGVEQNMDIDKDNDGLIEICDLEGIDEIHYQLDGTGYTISTGAMKITDGCPSAGCTGYELTRNLDFMDDNSYRISTNKAKYIVANATDAGWMPIGNSASVFFNATFEGNGNTISNLMINQRNTDYAGLFGYAQNSEINNLGLLGINIIGNEKVGGLAGANVGSITNSYTIGTVKGSYRVGGLVGWNAGDNSPIMTSRAIGPVGEAETKVDDLAGESGGITMNNRTIGTIGENETKVDDSTSESRGVIMNSHAEGSVSGISGIGGLVGWNDAGIITSSYAKGSVSGDSQIGGLIGTNQGDIMKSYATGDIIGENNDVGGLVGRNDNGSSIENSYATDNVSAARDVSNLVGNNSGTIANSYAIGKVAGRSETFGLVGGVGSTVSDSEISNSYWLSGSAVSSLSTRAKAEKTAEELKSPIEPGAVPTDVYYDWDDTIWDFGTSNQFPVLRDSDGNLLPGQEMNIENSDLVEGLRKLKILRVLGAQTSFDQPFGISTNNYTVMVSTPRGITTRSIVLMLEAYNPNADIQIFRVGDPINYFAGKRSGDESLPIVVDEDTKLVIMLNEPDTDYGLVFSIEELQSIQVQVKVLLEGLLM